MAFYKKGHEEVPRNAPPKTAFAPPQSYVGSSEEWQISTFIKALREAKVLITILSLFNLHILVSKKAKWFMENDRLL